MIILHPWSSGRHNDKLETWDFVARARKAGYEIIDRNINRPMDYPDLLREFWGKDDLVILEDDKVPRLADLKELAECNFSYCAFPYRPSFHFRASMKLWTEHFPYSLGFVRFSKEAQVKVPVETWYKEGEHWGVDKMIEEPLISHYGPFHIHRRLIKHNHNRGLKGRLGGLKYQVLGR